MATHRELSRTAARGPWFILLRHVVFGLRLELGFGRFVSHDLERDGRLVVDAGEQPAAIDFQEHRGQHRAGLACPASRRCAACLERHAAAAMGRKLEGHFLFGAVFIGSRSPHLSHPGAGRGYGSELPREGDVGGLEEVEEPLLESLHAGDVRSMVRGERSSLRSP